MGKNEDELIYQEIETMQKGCPCGQPLSIELFKNLRRTLLLRDQLR
jgi:hypothetical protein